MAVMGSSNKEIHMERETKGKRWTALFLAMMMLLSLFSVNVLAESSDMIVQEDEKIPEEWQEADVMESPEDGDILMPENAPEEQAESHAVREALAQNGYAYVLAQGPVPLWRSANMTQGLCFEIAACNSVLLATEYVEQESGDMVRVWLMIEEYEVLCGYVFIEVLAGYALTDEDAEALARQLWAWPVETEAGVRTVFVIEGDRAQEETPEQEMTATGESEYQVIVSDQWDSFLAKYANDTDEPVGLSFEVPMGAASVVKHGELDFISEDEPVKGRIALEKVGRQMTGFESVTDSFGNVCQKPVFKDRPLAGAVFEVRAAEDIIGKDGTVWFKAGEVVDTITTTESGKGSSRELPPGRYALAEVEAPSGYAFSEKAYEIMLTDDKTGIEARVKAFNVYMFSDIAMKNEKEVMRTVMDGSLVRQELVNTPGEGFVFGLYSAEDIRMGDVMLIADTLVTTGVTDAHGDLAFAGQFPHGEYLIRELAAPKGWKLSEKTYPVSLKPENAVANIIRAELPEAVHNELVYGTITLTKTDITGGEMLPGALIEVRDEQRNVFCRAYTDEHGEIPGIPVTPGRYTFRELTAPEGYALNEAVMTFEVDERGHVTGDHVIRDDYTRVCIRKQDENGEPLKGVEFGLFAENGTQVQTALTDESGLAVFERISYGEYDIRETKPLPGYVKNEHAQRVILDGHFVNPDEPVATFVNRHMQVSCIKVDTSGQRLAGVEFVLINANTDEIVEVVTSDEDGVFTFRRLDYGEWIIHELRAPESFSRMEDVTLHIDEDWTEQEPITCVSIPDHYEFMITDNHGEPLVGARFALETEDGTFIRGDLISGEDGIAHVTGLKPGQYVIREVEPAGGFMLTEKTLTVTIDADYVPPKKLRRLKNYPEDYSILQTGVDFLLTPLGWAGIGSMLAGITIWALYRTRKRRTPKGKA